MQLLNLHDKIIIRKDELSMCQIIKSRFMNYIDSIPLSQTQTDILNTIKLSHTSRVVTLSETLAASVSADIDCAKIIALLHDIGRWEQMRLHSELSDLASDHGEIGAEVVIQTDMLNGIAESKKSIILTAIREHNKKYTHIHDKQTQIFVDIIRDADKIDNFFVEVKNYGNDAKSMKKILPYSDEHRLSPRIYDCIMNHRLADSADRETLVDFKFFKLAWCFDLKIKKSFEIIRENGYIRDIFQDIVVPDAQMVQAYEQVCCYLNTV